MYQQTDTENSNHNGNGSNGSGPSGDQQVFHRRSKAGDVAGRFVEPGQTMADAITKTYLVSDNELNNIIRLWHKAQKWHVQAAMNDLLIKVNGARSKDGRSILAMLMSSAQILVPEWGAEVSKKSKDNMETIKKSREQRKNGDNDVDSD
ncbi:MAG: hypothetical protein WAU62_01920 [Dehalococcoidales bacterium]|jgi:hypothetical protein